MGLLQLITTGEEIDFAGAWPGLGPFPFGSCHHADFLKQSAPLGPHEYAKFIRGEIEAMRDVGLNSYDMNLAWFDLEVAPGRFDWRRTDAVYEACKDVGFQIFAWIFAELTPRWLVRDHPEAAAVSATGYRGPSHSYGSVVAREFLQRYVHAAVERYGDPVHVTAYNVGVESGLFWLEEQDSSEPAARLWDYNVDVLAGFGPWLERKYQTIDELNRIYRDHYEAFAEVEAPNSRFIQEQFMLINQVPWIDWRLYMCDLVSDYICFKARCVREVCPEAVISDQSYSIDPAFNGQDIWRTSECLDVVGTSMFASNDEGEHMVGSYWHDYFRSAAKAKPYWIWELRCGQNAWGLTNWGLPLSGEDVGRLTWQALAHEARNVQYWNWRPHQGGIEVGGHAMTARDGSLTPRHGAWARSPRPSTPNRSGLAKSPSTMPTSPSWTPSWPVSSPPARAPTSTSPARRSVRTACYEPAATGSTSSTKTTWPAVPWTTTGSWSSRSGTRSAVARRSGHGTGCIAEVG